ncbi:hypothetical protein NDU88_006790 [Pleurodeles waltl]|uniref:Uncharacterized protein n=1 Tax=Pleurodeles waltl TaxID=8319 RepID=A0AAV7TXU9_PLEWA|nr:hypothetical protein NDU88_006790 [Pleurodeles waltl]
MAGHAARHPQQQSHSAPRGRPPPRRPLGEKLAHRTPATQPNPGPNQGVQVRATGTQSQEGQPGRPPLTGPARATGTEPLRSSAPTTTRPHPDPATGQASRGRHPCPPPTLQCHRERRSPTGPAIQACEARGRRGLQRRRPHPSARSVPKEPAGKKQSLRLTQGLPPRPIVAHRSPGVPARVRDKIGHS